MKRLGVGIAILSGLVWLSGCDSGWLDTYWRGGDYRLLAIDTRGQMSLSLDQGHGTSLGLVDATVFSIGADDRYIVLKQHPATDAFGHFDRTRTNYFIVRRIEGTNFNEVRKGVAGPLTKDQFEKAAATLALPPFTKTFDDLQ